MAITIKHAKTDTIADWTQADLDAQIALGNFPAGTVLADIVLPSDWNNDHTVSGTIAIANGGTGQTTANAAINALLPSQTSQSGKVLSTNGTDTSWIAAGGTGTVTSVTGTAPVSVATGTTTPVISMAAATTSVNGYLTSTDWNTFNGKQNAFGSQTANYVYAAPDGTAGTPTFRALVATDIPSLSGTYVPYTGATAAVDLNAKSLTNISSLGINTTTVPTIKFRAFGDNGSTSRIAMRGYSADANSSAIRVTKFRGTYAAPQAPQNGDSLGKFELAGYGTTSSDGYAQASFEGVATEAWGATARGTKTLIKVTPNTTTTQATAVTIDQDKSVTLAGALNVTGTTTLATALSGLAKLTSGVVSTATSGTDYAPATSGSSILYGNGSGGFSNVTIGTGVSFAGGTLSATGSGGTVTSVTGTAPVVSSGGATPAISMAAASTTTDGYLTSTDWNTFNNKGSGTVTSVAVTAPSIFSVAGSPITSSGTIALTYSGTALPIANGGTGQTTASAAFNALSPLTTSGDILYGATSGAGTRLGIGTTGQVLTVSGGLPVWSTISSGSGTVTSVSVVSANGFAGTVATATTTPAITLTTSITGVLKGNGTELSAATSGTDYSAGTSALSTGILKSTTTTGALSIAVAADFPTLNQNTTGTAANVTGTVAIANGGTGQTTANAAYNALSPMTTTGDIEYRTAGSVAARLGIGTTGQVLTVASGIPSWSTITAGNASYDTATTSTGYFAISAGTTAQRPASPTVGMIRYNTTESKYEIYTGSEWQSITTAAYTYSSTYLVIAGGGGGAGAAWSGGGGAGGYLTSTLALSPGTTYTVTVGGGGAGGGVGARGTNGSNSVFSSITSTGGGGAGCGDSNGTLKDGLSGGSGGGGGSDGGSSTGNGGSGTSGQGNAGGNGGTDGATFRSGGGGGGAGAVGGNISGLIGGNGGSGSASSITGTSVTRGGGGAGAGNGTNGTAGSGGGGAAASAGTANTGGGGGGGIGSGSGGTGGSGVVILSVPTANYSGTTTGSPTVTTSGSNTILTYNSSGTYTG